jgi:tRNA A-37 threonylcarbamoyl transferase component Bud32
MEYLEGTTLYRKLANHQKWKEGLEQMVRKFHAEGLVHGDLRDANLFILDVDKTKAMILDFDWGGKEGEVRFPTPYLHCDLGVTGDRDLTIKAGDDVRTLEKALGQYRELGQD